MIGRRHSLREHVVLMRPVRFEVYARQDGSRHFSADLLLEGNATMVRHDRSQNSRSQIESFAREGFEHPRREEGSRSFDEATSRQPPECGFDNGPREPVVRHVGPGDQVRLRHSRARVAMSVRRGGSGCQRRTILA